jgi:hypothetical protein
LPIVKKVAGLICAIALFGLSLAGADATTRSRAGSSENMHLISKLRLTTMRGGISDVYAHNGFAYLGGWIPECPRAGVHVVNIKHPEDPRKVAFIPSGKHDYVAEGVFVFHMETPKFTGDVLVMSNEPCDLGDRWKGGVSLWDVTRPAHPRPLARGAGEPRRNGNAHAAHSAMAWQDGDRAYVVLVDNQDRRDVDILNITNPRKPRLIAETGLLEWPEARDDQASMITDTYGISFHHDMWVKEIDGHVYMLVSYWDAGFVLLNVDDPSNPVYVDDSTFTDPDPLFGTPTSEGNAHQAMWSTDNQFILASDEDFGALRFLVEIKDGSAAGKYGAFEIPWLAGFGGFEDRSVNGPVVYGGHGCPGTDPIPPAADLDLEAGEESIVVLQQDECRALAKARAADEAGYDALMLATSHAGSGFGDLPDRVICPSANNFGGIVGGCIGHRLFHHLFDIEPNYVDGGPEPALGARGREVTMGQQFDGYGYLHLLDAATLDEIDTFAIDEAMEDVPAGERPGRDLSVHEIKPDPRPDVRLGYASWYGGGARVIRFGPDGLAEVGHFSRGPRTDFWGTFPVARPGGRPLLLFSDRNLGLVVLEYTGPE